MRKPWPPIRPILTIDEKVIARFWAKVTPEPNTGCFLWTGVIESKGYGQLWVGNRMWGAHVISYEIRFGRLPDGHIVCHRCDNGTIGCVNPAHLFAGTMGDNVRDMVAKKRYAPTRVIPVRVPPLPCSTCGRLWKPLNLGRCHTCAEYYRRHGMDRVEKIRIRKVRVPPLPCSNCGKLCKPRLLGRCSARYHYFRLHGEERAIKWSIA